MRRALLGGGQVAAGAGDSGRRHRACAAPAPLLPPRAAPRRANRSMGRAALPRRAGRGWRRSRRGARTGGGAAASRRGLARRGRRAVGLHERAVQRAESRSSRRTRYSPLESRAGVGRRQCGMDVAEMQRAGRARGKACGQGHGQALLRDGTVTPAGARLAGGWRLCNNAGATWTVHGVSGGTRVPRHDAVGSKWMGAFCRTADCIFLLWC